jgi:chromate transport protein ChrA
MLGLSCGGYVMALNLDELLIQVVVNIVIMAPVLWLSGRALVGKEKAKFVDAIWIVVLGTVISTVFNALFDGIIASIILLIILLALVKHFFDCGWLKAFVVAVLAVIIFVVIVTILGIIGIGIGLTLWAL